MALYSFTPIDLPPPPATAPGTDFQDLAAADLAGVDAADALLSSGFSAASGFLADGYNDAAGIGVDIANAASLLDGMIAEAESDDLTPYILAALDQDSALGSLAGDVGSSLSLIPGNLLAGILQGITGWATEYINATMYMLANEIEANIMYTIAGWLSFYY